MSKQPRKPRVVKLNRSDNSRPIKKQPEKAEETIRKPRAQNNLAMLTPVSDELAQIPSSERLDDLAGELTPPPATPPKRRFSFARILLFGLGGLVTLGFGLTIDRLVRELFARNDWLGWLALGLTGLVVLAALGIIVREIAGLMRLRQIEALRQKTAVLSDQSDMRSAGKLADQLMELYAARPDTARGRAALKAHEGEIIDGPDLIALVERDLIAPLDKKAREAVLSAAKRVSVVTAVSPRAIVDIAYVAIENMRLIRHLSELYGGRPGTIGMMRLARNVLGHLAVTGSIAIGDSVIQQFVGHGLAARLSSRLGEGVINGLLTARVGISAIDLCRPMPFAHEKRPGVGDFMADLLSTAGSQKKAG